jgi:hypothetical protein
VRDLNANDNLLNAEARAKFVHSQLRIVEWPLATLHQGRENLLEKLHFALWRRFARRLSSCLRRSFAMKQDKSQDQEADHVGDE